MMYQASVGSVGEFGCSYGTSHQFGTILSGMHILELQTFNLGEGNIGGLANMPLKKKRIIKSSFWEIVGLTFAK